MLKSFSSVFDLRSSQKRYLFLLILAVVTLPVNININALAIGLFVLNSTLSTKRQYFEKNRTLNITYSLLAAFFLIHLISILYSDDIETANLKIQTKLSFILLPFAYYTGLSQLGKEQLILVKRVFILGVLAITLWCYAESTYQAFLTSNLRQLTDSYLSNPLMHRGYLSIFIGIAFMLWWRDSTFLPRLRLFSMIIFPVTVFLLQGRINILALFVVALGYLLFAQLKRLKFKQILIIGVGTVFVVSSFFLIPKEYNRFNQPLTIDYDFQAKKTEEFTGMTIRLAIWHNVNNLVKENWLKGIGIGDYKSELYKQYQKTEFYKGLESGFNCHNQYYESLLAVGILGVLLLVAILVNYLMAGSHFKAPFLSMIVIFFFLSMITESVLERHWGITTFCMIIPLYLKIVSIESGEEILS